MERKIRRSLIKLATGTVITMILVGIVLFYSTVQTILIDQVTQNNQRYSDQVAATFEIIMDQIADQLYKLSIYDSELLKAIEERKVTISSAKTLYDLLDSIVISNKYLYSAYLYSHEEDSFFTSDRGSAYSSSEFNDPSVLEAVKFQLISKINPRIVTTVNHAQKLLSAVVIPISVNSSRSSCVLIVNIDMEELYLDILKSNNVSHGTEVYICNSDGKILVAPSFELISSDIEQLFDDSQKKVSFASLMGNMLRNEPVKMHTNTFSNKLNWNFYLKSDVHFDSGKFFNQYAIVFGAAVLACTILVVSYLFIRKSTKPINEMIVAYNEKILKDLLIDSNNNLPQTLEQLNNINHGFMYKHFCVALIDIVNSKVDLYELINNAFANFKSYLDTIDARCVYVAQSSVAIIFNFEDEPQEFRKKQATALEYLYERLTERSSLKVYFCISAVKDADVMLPIAYRECFEMQEYKISLLQHINYYENFQTGTYDDQYTPQLEKQIINNLIVGNEEGCSLYADKFMSYLFDREDSFTDLQIKNSVYQLQNEILKRVTSLPISIKIDSESYINTFYKKSEIHEWLFGFIESIIVEINKKNTRDESVLIDSIFAYIDSNIAGNDFNLNSLSYQFNLNRNYLTKLIKEHTGQNFNEYINAKKILIAKELLEDKSLTIDAIAHEIGFTYAHYFIKIFKAAEGITPGQYREMILDNKNA